MPKILFIDADGSEHATELAVGTTLMQGAADNLLSGILAECGGSCSCGTCQCYVEDAWAQVLGRPNEVEAAILEGAREPHKNARLSCQVTVTDEMDGMTLRIPSVQY